MLVKTDPVLPGETSRSVFAELHPPLTGPKAQKETHRCLECGGPSAPAPCVMACPTHIEIPKFIREIREGRLLDSARTIFKSNVLGGSCSRVCPVEVLCQGACVLLNEGRRPVAIGLLQRHATDWALQNGSSLMTAAQTKRDKSIGIIGAGAAGLACAAELAQLGYSVVVYDRKILPGGLITYAIAPYKQIHEPLPQEVKLLAQLGIEFRFGVTVGKDIALEELEKHTAIFLGVGLGEDWPINLPGEELKGIWNSLDFIERIKDGSVQELRGNTVAVIGGGNTAIDAARESVRLGAKQVFMLYRRSEKEMPAYPHEVAWARKEGVQILWLVMPLRFLGGAHVQKVECIRMKLVAPEGSGRPKPEPVPGTEWMIDVDVVIKAIGQQPRKAFLEKLGIALKDGKVQINDQYQTSRKGYFAGGDCINGGGTAVEAVADGKSAAQSIHRVLN